MAHYFFHIEGHRAHEDEVGEECAHDEAAWQSSVRMLRDLEHGFAPGDEWQLRVHHDDTPVFLISVRAHRLR